MSALDSLSTVFMDSSFFLILVAAVIGFLILFKKFKFQQDNKEIRSSSLSLPSPPTYVSCNWKHHVFPSFHGADVRKTFLCHILESFKRKGIDTFIDNHIERSKSIGPELIEAIRGSKIGIVLLSKNYASSSWCLDELVEIMKCREVLGQIVMTIFYEVDPADIRKQKGDFGKAFRKTCKGKTKQHIQRWRKALEDVAQIAGEHSRNWENDTSMIENIATDVSNMLHISTPSRDFDDLVGMRSHMEEMKQLLCLDSSEVRMIGIWGPPGIGKTTIARFLFNQISNRFQLGTIMVNIKGCYPRPCLDEYSAQLQLQNQMMSQIINQKDIMISHLGVAQERLEDKKVLLVLDDVDQSGQLNALAKKTEWFGSGSRIIVTTEDLRVLKAHMIDHIYKMKYPSSDEAFQIFCMHAFGQKHPYDGFCGLAWEVKNLVGELPLGLKVLGSSMRGMSKQEWKRTLPRLKTRLDGQIESIIKFSYDALYDEEKDLFLYIACFFQYYRCHHVEELLAKKFTDVRHSLGTLVEKSFISINQYESIEMHILLEQFGRETSRTRYIHSILKRQLLIDARDICEDTIDSGKFIGIQLKFSKSDDEKLDISEKAVERMSDVQFLSINGSQNAGSERRLYSLLFHSQKIRALRWNNFQNICLPSTFNSESLIELAMSGKLQKLWEGTKPLKNLKRMDLSYSKDLKELPDLSTATNLKSLVLHYCSNLVELPIIGDAIKLAQLDLDNCSSLMKLPSSINATSLKTLTLYNCSRVVKLPAIDNATNLQNLGLSCCSSLVELPLSIGTATNLLKLDISGCSSLMKLPSSIGDITCLREFNLSKCLKLMELPSSIGTATNIEELNISGCSSLVKIPSSIGDITCLRKFNLSNCLKLMELPPSIRTATNIEELNISGCWSLSKLPSSVGDLTCLRKFDLSNCSSLVELPPSIGTATNIEELNISGCSSLVKLPSSVGDITCLREFNLSKCLKLMELPSSIGNLQQLKELSLRGCLKLEALPTNINLKSLWKLDLSNCTQLNNFPEISTNIRTIALDGTAIKEVPLSIMSWSKIDIFTLSYFESLKKFSHALDIITELVLVSQDIHEIAPWVKGMSHLRLLTLHDCNNLVSLPQLPDSLICIYADNCKSLERLDYSFNNPMICLMFTNCYKLNLKARDLIMHTSTHRYAVLPGTQVPIYFNYRSTAGGSLTINLNETSLRTPLRFKACITLVKGNEETRDYNESWKSLGIKIMFKHMHRTVYCKYFTVKPITEHIYTFEVEVTRVTSPELVFEFKTNRKNLKVGECGILQVVEVPIGHKAETRTGEVTRITDPRTKQTSSPLLSDKSRAYPTEMRKGVRTQASWKIKTANAFDVFNTLDET